MELTKTKILKFIVCSLTYRFDETVLGGQKHTYLQQGAAGKIGISIVLKYLNTLKHIQKLVSFETINSTDLSEYVCRLQAYYCLCISRF
jgi:hypothetical protein